MDNTEIVEATEKDDRGFVDIVRCVIESYKKQFSPDVIFAIQIDNWFDHKWLNFSGLVCPQVGVWKDPVTIPAFNPKRVLNQSCLSKTCVNTYELIGTRPLHAVQNSSENFRRKLDKITQSGIFVWWSGNTDTNRAGSLMCYIQTPEGQDTWYASFKDSFTWKVHKTKGIPSDILLHTIRKGKEILCPVIQQIRVAFDGVRLEDGVSACQARAMDDYRTEEQQKKARLEDTEESWEEITDNKIEGLNDVLPFLDAKGLRFYMPAFMIYALRYPHSSSYADEGTVYQLMIDVAESCPDDRARFEERFSLFTPHQRHAVYCFLDFCRKQDKNYCYTADSADEAIKQYWHQFSEAPDNG